MATMLSIQVVFVLSLFSFVKAFVHPVVNYRSFSRFHSRSVAVTVMNTATEEKFSTDFQYLKSLDKRCSQLSNLEGEFMLSFWSEEKACFDISPQINSTRVSITTTCISLLGVLANAEHWVQYAEWEQPKELLSEENGRSPRKISIKRSLDAVKNSKWSSDAFQTAVIVTAFCKFNSFDGNDPKFVDAVERLLDQRSRLSLHRLQKTSAFCRYQTARALLALVESDSVPSTIRGTKRIGFALERANMVAFDELCRQLAFYNCGDTAYFDIIILVFNLLTYWNTSQSLFLGSFARGVVPQTNMKLVTAALEIIFASQRADGTWMKGEPINNQADESNTSRDIGNNYVFFFDVLSGILEEMGESHPQLLAPYLDKLTRALDWAENNIKQEMIPESKDSVSGRERGRLVKGWRSNHLGNGGAVGWCTAQVFLGISRFKRLVKALITDSVLSEFDGRKATAPVDIKGSVASSKEWERLLDTDLELSGVRTTLKAEIYDRLLKPHLDKESKILAELLGRPGLAKDSTMAYKPPLYSAILFGPPGTAKTTICTSVASYLGWNFLTIDTACFLANGFENIAARMSYVFGKLAALERTIILFDEIEEFCMDRENPSIGMESRLLTTAMLTQLNDLRRKQGSVFIVATNRLRSFDAAVTRPGRFDMLLFVGTLNLGARCSRLRAKLDEVDMPSDDKLAALELFENYLESKWEELRFLSFAENESLIAIVADLVSRKELTIDAIDAKVTNIIKTATIKGPIREEYLASETLSRI